MSEHLATVAEMARDSAIAGAYATGRMWGVRVVPWWRRLLPHRCAACGRPAFHGLEDFERRRFCVPCWGVPAHERGETSNG